MSELVEASVRVIRDSQSPNGAYPAAVGYPTYDYCWFRDGSFIAHAMDVTGNHDSAARFHGWAAAAITAREETIRRAIDKAHAGTDLEPGDLLDTRYSLDGDESKEDWPNFQLDGFGTWLWALHGHAKGSGRAVSDMESRAAQLVADYLASLWQRPCYDCWEEFPDDVHTYTLAAIHGGLAAHQSLADADHTGPLAAIGEYLDRTCAVEGHFTKHVGSSTVDASLIGLATPYGVVSPDDPRMAATVELIESTLRTDGGGVRRYATDSFYGGGEWVVLAGWLAWHHAETGAHAGAHRLLAWIEDQADGAHLPEQVSRNLNAPEHLEPWIGRWGAVARPLLWSHAMYLTARASLPSMEPERPLQLGAE